MSLQDGSRSLISSLPIDTVSITIGGSPMTSSKNCFQSKAPPDSTLSKIIEKIHLSNTSTHSQKVIEKLNKLIRTGKKARKIQEDLIGEISSWKDSIANEDSKKILSVFGVCLETRREIEEELAQKQENLRLQLISVKKRESKANDFKYKRNRLYKFLREQESKMGDTASISLTKEHLEELSISVEVVGEQYIRSINSLLRTSIINYFLSLSINSLKMKHDVDHCFSEISSLPASSKNVLHPYSGHGVLLRTADMVRFQKSLEMLGSESGSPGSETPKSMNPLNQGENKPSNSKYINILTNLHYQRNLSALGEATEITIQTDKKGAKCNMCARHNLHCNHHLTNQAKEKLKESSMYKSSAFSGDGNHGERTSNDSNKINSNKNSFPGGLGIRFPSVIANQDQWGR